MMIPGWMSFAVHRPAPASGAGSWTAVADRLAVALVASAPLAVVGCGPTGAAGHAGPQPARPAARAAVEGPRATPVEVVPLAGEPAEIGRTHGRALGERIRVLEDRYLTAIFGGRTDRDRALAAAAAFRPLLRPRHRAELDAVAAAVGLPPERMLLANAFLDLLPSVGCSTIALPAAASTDGIPRFGRNLDFPSFGVADSQSLVVVVRPTGRHAFAAVTWPGLVGVLSGMNEHGLALANMEVARAPRVPDAMPYPFLYRTILEECRTVDEAVALLRSTGRQSANNLMLMDADGARALVEIAPDGIVVRRASDDAPLVSTNHQRGDRDEPGRCTRYDCLATDAARGWGRLDRAGLQTLLARAGQGDLTLQSMIFEPGERRLFLALGARAASREFQPVDLGGWFFPAPATR